MSTFTSGGIFVRESGEGTPLVLLHAFPLDSRLYEAQLSERFAGFWLLAPDLPGFGGTPWREEGGEDLDSLAALVLGALDARGVERFLVGGTSMGGYIAMALVRRAPERVLGLVLSDTRAGPDDDQARARREESARRILSGDAAAYRDELVPKLLGPATLEGKPEVVAAVRAMARDADPRALASALRAMAGRPDSTAMLAAARLPALVLVGDDDVITPVAVARALVALLPGARLVTLAAAGHLPAIETPRPFSAALREFLDALAGSPPS